ncbi:hypothetical protein LguiB_005257 [Lonicera macranthoides]
MGVTLRPCGGYYSNNFELWNQNLYSGLVSGMQRLELDRHEDNSRYLQGGSVYNNYVREEMIQWLHESPDLFIAAAFHETRNFVVQHVLSLHNPQVTAEICSRLRDHYSQLSLNQRGSHVVEKCIASSPLGMTYAVQEFLEDEKVLCQIARNEFGNYVIQRALKITKVSGSKLYQSLVNTLDAKALYIGKNRYGRNVINLIKGIIPERRKMVGCC